MKRIAVLTSGGDAPGMNAAIRAVVNKGIEENIEVYGVYYGYRGLVEGDFRLLTVANTSHFISRGGTFLYSARYEDFVKEEVQLNAIEQLKEMGIDGLVVIGGDGSLKGALSLTKHGFPAVGIPATIDNDIPGTEYTIGFDTAMNVALGEIDKISDTAMSHNRTFVIEVMGRQAGDLAIWAGVAAGADEIIIPEIEFQMEEVVKRVQAGRRRGKDHSIIVLAEGVMNVEQFVEQYKKIDPNHSLRGITLAHVQRGGSPTGRDRVLASMMGAQAVSHLKEGNTGIYLGVQDDRLIDLDIVRTLSRKRQRVRQDLYDLNKSFTPID